MKIDPTYIDWTNNDCCVITWLLDRMEEKVSSDIMFLKTTKEMWNTLKEIYGNEKHSYWVFELYECLFALQ